MKFLRRLTVSWKNRHSAYRPHITHKFGGRLEKISHTLPFYTVRPSKPNSSVSCAAGFSESSNRYVNSEVAFFSFFSKIRIFTLFGRSQHVPTAVMMQDNNVLQPPDSVKSMKVLDKDAFQKMVQVPGFYVPLSRFKSCSVRFKKELLRLPGVKPIAELAEGDEKKDTHKLYLLNPEKVSDVSQFFKENADFFKENGISIETVKMYDLELGYKNWTHQEILKGVLPEESDGVAGFSTIGHIIHVNLREDVTDYKQLIGEVLLDKVSSARTVVNKLNVIDNTYRNFQMELLAGEDNMVTTTREHGCVFELDFSKVYWNSRLSTEHQRVTSDIAKTDIVYDVFAGIGPFAVPAAKKGCTVHANDLNPESYKWLQHNFKLNKVKHDHFTYNMDGRQFITSIIKKDLLTRCENEKDISSKYHIVMNLPALAIDFLDAFVGLWDSVQQDIHIVTPIVYCYCFSKEDDKISILKRVEEKIGCAPPDDTTVRFVRNVAPNKDMHCVIFQLPREVLLAKETSHVTGEDCMSPPRKKQKEDP